MRERTRNRRIVRTLLGVVGLATLSAIAPACGPKFDTSRVLPARASVGEEMFGVICDRFGAQALREDLTGDSFRAICHRRIDGSGERGASDFANEVDTSKLPPIDPAAVNEAGEPVSVEDQEAQRAWAVGRIQALARRRADVIRALDATFPEEDISVKDVRNGDPKRSCDAPQDGDRRALTDELADMLGRMADLYNDGTLPHSTESLAKVIDGFLKAPEAQAAWSRISGRQGYKPIETALGVLRPSVAYPHLRDLSNASLRLLSADSNPYQLDPEFDADGNRVPVPGPGNEALNKLLEAAHEELLDAKPTPRRAPLTSVLDPSVNRVVLSRPRDNVELVQELMFTSDPTFGTGPSSFIVRRDARGFAMIAGGALIAPFVDVNKDNLPDVDDQGRFRTTDGSLAPSPFPFPGSPPGARDAFGRAMVGNHLLYEYVDTSHTLAARVASDLRPLLNPDPNAKHETLMDLLAGAYVAVGARESASKSYPTKTLQYQGVRISDSPALDLVHAAGVVLADRNTDALLSMARDLVTTRPQNVARTAGGILAARDVATRHPEAQIPNESTFWDEILDVTVKLAREPGLLEDLMRALAAPDSANLGALFAQYAKVKDEITYDRDDINGPSYNLTTGTRGGEMVTAVDRTKPQTGSNRSALFRFLQLISDTAGVATCNRPGAKVHAVKFGIPVTMPPLGIGSYAECGVYKIDDLAMFYVDAMTNAQQFDPPEKPNKRGAFFIRDSTLRDGFPLPGGQLAAASVGLMKDSSHLDPRVADGSSWWRDDASPILAPRPEWVNRFVFFDHVNDTKNSDTAKFIGDLQGEHFPSSVCAERVIPDPYPNLPDRTPDGLVHLRDCPEGRWLDQRIPNTIFTWEHFGFYQTMRPLLTAFVRHNREDLFLALATTIYRHWPAADASVEECLTPGARACPRTGLTTYEPLLGEALVTDLVPALSELVKVLDQMPVKRCDQVDPTTNQCVRTTVLTGVDVAAAATRAMLDPDYARNALKLTDRRGAVTARRNDGGVNPQVTPVYLLTGALRGIDAAFDAYAKQHPDDKDRQAQWQHARSQLVDQFLGVVATPSGPQFANPIVTKAGPIVIDLLRSQLLAHCPTSFTPPFDRCAWARDEVLKTAQDILGGPLAASGLEVMDAVRRDPDGRREIQRVGQYLLDPASKNDALASVLASAHDVVQMLRDDENLLPLLKVLATAVDASVKDENGRVVEKSLLDAQMALLARVSGRYFDRDGDEVCSREIDPNQVLAVALGHLVTPIRDGAFKGQTPLEVIIDVVADVNRTNPSKRYEGTLARDDYASVGQNVVEFLTDKERGLEQFYEVIRQGTKF